MRTTVTRVVVTVAVASWIAAAGTAGAGPPLVKRAKDLGYPAQNCQYCHSTKLPKKETFTPGELNDRGRWLRQERERRKAAQVDLSWLKDYPGGKEQK